MSVVCVSVCVWARATFQIWEEKRCSLLLRTRQPKFLHRPKRLRCDSDPAGAATPQIAPPTRAPAGRRLTDARHSRHARSRSHHGHRSATVTPESLQAAGIEAAVRHDTVVSRRRRRHATAASSDFFCVPFGGRANGRVSTPRPTPSPTTAAPGAEYADCADCGPRFPPLRPCAPRRATGHPTPIATTVAPARVPPGPGRQHVGPDHRASSHVTC